MVDAFFTLGGSGSGEAVEAAAGGCRRGGMRPTAKCHAITTGPAAKSHSCAFALFFTCP